MASTQEGKENIATSTRLRKVSPLRQLLVRPEVGAVVGAIAVWIFFAVAAGNSGFLSLAGTSTYLTVAAELGILAVPVALLMIGGEFDLSIGSIVGASSMIIVILSTQFHINLWISICIAFLFALGAGALNGYLVLRTRLPSFIVTLATQYILAGATIGTTRLITGLTEVGGLKQASGYDSAHAVFASTFMIGGQGFAIEIIWWLLLVAIGSWILLRTAFGNWIFGVGGDVQAARNVGVPVARVKILLFMGTAAAACLLAVIQVATFSNADVLRGQGNEFLAIVAVVVGGVLLTGGYGSVIGSLFGALIFGMVRQGIIFAGVDADWYQVFLGVMLLLAVLLNSYVRRTALETKR